MSSVTMPIAERIQLLKSIFTEFGIKVEPNSSLDLAIQAEFGRGKRSPLNKILQEFQQGSDAAILAACIGKELSNNTKDPQLINIGKVLQQSIPCVLNILDIKQQTTKRELLLTQLLEHLESKLPTNSQTERLSRMLQAAKENLHNTAQVQSLGQVFEYSGVACRFEELANFGKILQIITPALIMLDQDSVPFEQKINHCVNALRGLGCGLRHSNLQLAANIVDDIHSLAQVCLPSLADKATVENALNSLGITLGNISTQEIINRAQKVGLTSQEITQMLYACESHAKISPSDIKLLSYSQQNQQYAAICGYVAKLGIEIEQPQLEKIGIAGICLASLRQTYCEIKTNNLTAANFSESLGTILSGAGAITKNSTLEYIGKSILDGTKVYAGIMALPGGATVAIPLAICSVIGKVLIETNLKKTNKTFKPNNALYKILEEVVHLQKDQRYELSKIHNTLQQQHRDLILALDQGFNNLELSLKTHTLQNAQALKQLDYKVDCLQYSINKEFSDWYLEYVREPLEAIDFAAKYG